MIKIHNAAFITLTTAILLFNMPVSSANDDDVVGIGDLPCTTIIRLYDNGDPAARKVLLQKVEQWSLGYMSGLNKKANDNAKRELSYFAMADLGYNVLSECRVTPARRIREIVADIYSSASIMAPESV